MSNERILYLLTTNTRITKPVSDTQDTNYEKNCSLWDNASFGNRRIFAVAGDRYEHFAVAKANGNTDHRRHANCDCTDSASYSSSQQSQ